MGKPSRRIPRYQRESKAKETAVPKNHRIPADLAEQAPNNSYGPPLYYEDYEFTCVDCGSREVWTAEQQKWWFEVAKGSIYSKAIRCRACRQPRRAAAGRSEEEQQGG